MPLDFREYLRAPNLQNRKTRQNKALISSKRIDVTGFFMGSSQEVGGTRCETSGNHHHQTPRLIHQPIIKSQQMTTTLFVVQQQVCHVAIAQNQGLSPRKAHRSWFVVGKTTSCLLSPVITIFYRWYIQPCTVMAGLRHCFTHIKAWLNLSWCK